MTHEDIRKLIYKYIEQCHNGEAKFLTGYQFEVHIRTLSGEDRVKVRGNILEVFGILHKRGELSSNFCEKIIEQDDCPCEYKTVLRRDMAGRLID